VSGLFYGRLLNETDIVAFEHNATESLALGHCLDVVLFGIIKHQVHVFIKSNDCALNTAVDIFKDPDANTRAILKVPEDQVDGLHHH
jgi:hypothetical protein